MAKIISMFNHKGGVSKTTTSFHLGWALAEKHKRVLLIDDFRINLRLPYQWAFLQIFPFLEIFPAI